MDEVTLVNLLNKICECADSLDWKLNCTYHDGLDASIMQVELFDRGDFKKRGYLTFRMETSAVIGGKYKGLVPFTGKSNVIDVLLDILHYESTTTIPSYN